MGCRADLRNYCRGLFGQRISLVLLSRIFKKEIVVNTKTSFFRIIVLSLLVTAVIKAGSFCYGHFLLDTNVAWTGSKARYLFITVVGAGIFSQADPVSPYVRFLFPSSNFPFLQFHGVLDLIFWVFIVSLVGNFKRGKAFGISLCGILTVLIGNHIILANILYVLKASPNPTPYGLTALGILFILGGVGLLLGKRWGWVLSLIMCGIVGAINIISLFQARHVIEETGGANIAEIRYLEAYYSILCFLVLLSVVTYYLTRPNIREQLR